MTLFLTLVNRGQLIPGDKEKGLVSGLEESWEQVPSRSPTPILVDAAGGGAVAMALSVRTPVSSSPSCGQGLDLTGPIPLLEAGRMSPA